MKKALLLLVVLGVAVGAYWSWTSRAPDTAAWRETTATITDVQRLDDGTFAYAIRYTPEGENGEPIAQYALGVPQEPVDGQSVKMRYRVQEPVIYELLEELKWRAE